MLMAGGKVAAGKKSSHPWRRTATCRGQKLSLDMMFDQVMFDTIWIIWINSCTHTVEIPKRLLANKSEDSNADSARICTDCSQEPFQLIHKATALCLQSFEI